MRNRPSPDQARPGRPGPRKLRPNLRSVRWFSFAEAKDRLQGLAAVVLDADVEASGRVFVSLAQVGMRVRLARRMNLGLTLIEETHPHLVLLSTQLPDGDSLSLVERLLALPEPPPRVIAIGQGGGRNERRRFLQAGCEVFISKPIDLHLFAQDLAYELALADAVPASSASGG